VWGGAAREVVVRAAPHQVVLTGFTRARAAMALVSEVAGRCLEVRADVGDTIAPDGVFARLDATFVRLELEANRIQQRRLANRVAYLTKELKRTQSLVRRRSQAQARLDARQHELDQARFQLQTLEVQGRILAERLARFTIKAPPGWRVIARRLEPGQWVPVGAVVGRVGDFRTLLVPLALTLREYRALKAMAGHIRLQAPELGMSVPARIQRVEPAFDPATRKVRLDLVVAGGLPEMRGGVRLELRLPLPDPSGAVLVPAAAVSERYQEHWLTKAGGERLRVVVLGPGPEPHTLRVASPRLKPGDRVLVPARSE